MSAPHQQPPAPGWYPDPAMPSMQRYWDGQSWTQQIAPVATHAPAHDSYQWGMLAHLSALLALIIGLSFVGPLVIYLMKKDQDPYVRAHAVEALNFNLSFLIYMVGLGFLTLVLFFFIIGIFLIPVIIALAVAWFVLTIVAAMKANRGEGYRYPLTIRFLT